MASKLQLKTYYPLILVFLYIAGTTLLIGRSMMTNFMGGFFLVFSFFKLLDLRGFAKSYRTYDVVAKAIPAYAFVYPFLELTMGVAYVTRFSLPATHLATLVIMGVSSVGVVRSLVKREAIECACLGTVFNLPMTKITLFEDVLMAGMAAVMLAF